MSTGILLITLLIELLIGLCHFIVSHDRRRFDEIRRLERLSKWEQFPYKWYALNSDRRTSRRG